MSETALTACEMAMPMPIGLTEETDKRIFESGDYYHGFLPRVDCEEMLKNDGDFLVRQRTHWSECEMERVTGDASWRQQPQHRSDSEALVLSVRWEQPLHAVIGFDPRGYFSLGKMHFTTVQDLVSFYYERHLDEGIAYSGDEAAQSSGALTFGKQPRRMTVLLRHPVGSQSSWQLSEDAIDVRQGDDALIATNHFSTIRSGSLKTADGEKEVAVKLCDVNAPHHEKVLFLREMRTLRRLCSDHQNIVKFYGVQATNERHLMTVFALAKHRSMIRFMTTGEGKEGVSAKQKVNFCIEASQALRYLQTKNVLHLDVAARNCLVEDHATGMPDKKYTLILADFNLSKEGPSYHLKHSDQFAPAYTAPELLHGNDRVATAASDIWSYGVLVWEIYTGCQQRPWAQIEPPSGTNIGDQQGPTVQERMHKTLSAGERLPLPSTVPTPLRNVVDQCWRMEPAQRISPQAIVDALQNMENNNNN